MWILKSVDWIHLAQDRVYLADSCGHSNEHSDSIKGKEFICQMSSYQLQIGLCSMELEYLINISFIYRREQVQLHVMRFKSELYFACR